MDSVWQEVGRLLTHGDSSLWPIVWLSVQVSGTAVVIGSLIGLPLAAWLVMQKGAWVVTVRSCLNALMGFPPVVLGLLVYLLLSRSGPLGHWGILFTPSAMVVAQVLLITPIITALAAQSLADEHRQLARLLDVLHVRGLLRLRTLLWETRHSLFTAVLAGLGRAFAEVGAVMMVGGNIDGATRVMTTAIALETSKGELATAIALGIILLCLVFLLNLLAQAVRRK
ncbi:MAG: hypothetical protein RLZZ502_1782 [Pseudomonadota bacterium]|jgi:tungstate transport system permease protein